MKYQSDNSINSLFANRTWQCFHTLVVLLLAGSAGCSPKVLLENPAVWPAEWEGRRLYHTPNAFIYASSETVAGDADRLVQQVRGDLRARLGVSVDKGLVIVTDIGDKPLFQFKELLELEFWGMKYWMHEGNENPMSHPEEDLKTKIQEAEAKLEQTGIKIDDLLISEPLDLTESDYAGLIDFPAEPKQSVVWSVAIPSRPMIAKATQNLIRSILASKDINVAQKAFVAPLLLTTEPLMLEQAAKKRNITLFQAFVNSRPELKKKQKKKAIAQYRKDHGD